MNILKYVICDIYLDMNKFLLWNLNSSTSLNIHMELENTEFL